MPSELWPSSRSWALWQGGRADWAPGMITREFGDGGWKATAAGNPPPLHIRDTESLAAQWHPLPRPYLQAQPGGPLMVTIPHLPADELGEDPTDPARCHRPRQATAGLVGRLNVRAGTRNVGPRGERR